MNYLKYLNSFTLFMSEKNLEYLLSYMKLTIHDIRKKHDIQIIEKAIKEILSKFTKGNRIFKVR